jgi:hypothetical protein
MPYYTLHCLLACVTLPQIAFGIGPAIVSREPLSEHAFFWSRASIFEAHYNEIVSSNSQGFFVRVTPVGASLKIGFQDLPVVDKELIVFVEHSTLLISGFPSREGRILFTGFPRDKNFDPESFRYIEKPNEPEEFLIIPHVVMPWKGVSFLPIMNTGELTPEKQKLFDNMLATCIRESEKVYQNKKK